MREQDITIHRGVTGDDPNFISPRAAPQDRTLTWEARGVLWYLLSQPGDWIVKPHDLQQTGSGRDKTYKILDELIEHHYILKTRIPGPRKAFRYDVFAQPCRSPENQDTENQGTITYTDNKLPDSDSITPSDSENLHTSDKSDKAPQSEESDEPKKKRKQAIHHSVYLAISKCAFGLEHDQINGQSTTIGAITYGQPKKNIAGFLQIHYHFAEDYLKRPIEEYEQLASDLSAAYADFGKQHDNNGNPLSAPRDPVKIEAMLIKYLSKPHQRATTITPLGNGATLRDGIAYDATGKIIPPVLPPRLPPIHTKKEPEYDF